jgi:crotonobetainyl-CoA:carnitine CoA-transferase CaiB-like acyl-CoA transferase
VLQPRCRRRGGGDKVAVSLTGCRVLELGGYIAAPFATLLLANLGADVIKVEPPNGDPSRGRSANFMPNNSGKRSIALDLKDPRSRKIWEDLVRSSDVVVQNMGDEATKSLSVGYEECRSLQPQIVYCHIRGFGAGPYGGRPATNPIVEALTGLMSITFNDGRPARQGSSFYDQMAGLFAALGVVAALSIDDRSTGKGFVELDLFETALYSVAARLTGFSMEGELAGDTWEAAPYGTFKTADGAWIFLGVISDSLWRSFCSAMGLAEFGRDPELASRAKRLARKEFVNDLAQKAIAQVPKDRLLAQLDTAGVPAAPVLNFQEVLADPQVQHPGKLFRSTYKEYQTMLPSFPVIGEVAVNPQSTSSPGLGEHASEILKSLNYPEGEIATLIDGGVVTGPSQDPS